MNERMRVLITGSRGYIGATLRLALENTGFDVWGVDVTGETCPGHVRANLLDAEEAVAAIRSIPSIAAIVHTAALVPGRTPPPGETCQSANMKMLENVVGAAEVFAPRMIFFSSVTVYGADRREGPVSVDAELRPSTDYGVSKLRGEQLLSESALPHCDILRLAPVWSEPQMAAVRKRVFLPGPLPLRFRLYPAPRYSLCHVDTVVGAVVKLLSAEPGGRRVFNVADPEAYDQQKLASRFPGWALPVPVLLAQPIYWLAALLPSQRSYAIRCLFWKLFRSNIYEVSAISPTQAGGECA